ncbi:L-asparaginase [Fodinibius salinus]|uniref:asparaginase n=1 Tax=Fodinibius salinus TaxID=860790 RepID=A0A5D3YPF8_9BACT|nr:asparaginase [Fodinibius salinus]TYP94919.1 L-asparaginase [Fodinibius salinus]
MKKILLIQTGGTIAMDIGDDNNPTLDTDRWTQLLYEAIPELSKIADIQSKQLFSEDSSDINKKHWSKLATFIHEHYRDYNGFVVLHGTDTMAYTASALSFALQNLDKPIIFTGSQVPMRNIRSDARRNLINAIEMATMPLPEVAICFNDFVYRGNRATKMSIGDFDAFSSPNYSPLAEIGLNIEISDHILSPAQKLQVSTEFNDQVFLQKIHPNLNPKYLQQIDFSNIRALIIEAFGSGNFPIHGEQSLLPFFKRCVDEDTLLIITSQADYDAVELNNYESGRKAIELGALSAKDMTTEATLTKIMYLLGKYDKTQNIINAFNHNIAGEITE